MAEIPDFLRKRRARRNAIREIVGDLPAVPRSVRNSGLAYGFDVDCRSGRVIKSVWGDDYDINLFGRLGLLCYNFQLGTNFQFVRWEKYSMHYTANVKFYITLEAKDPASDNIFSFQTLFNDVGRPGSIGIKWSTLACRIKCDECLDDYWDDKEIDASYKGEMPKWFSDEALAADYKKFYVVQESELHENDWLYLFLEIACFSRSGYRLDAPPLLEIKNVVVQTNEDSVEACEKLKANNAIFYISYKHNPDPSTTHDADPSTTDLVGDHKAIIRKTMDGKPGHMCLEIAE